jgi:hypothetical protein
MRSPAARREFLAFADLVERINDFLRSNGMLGEQ